MIESLEANLKLMAARTQADRTVLAAGGVNGKDAYESARIENETYSPFWAAMAHTD